MKKIFPLLFILIIMTPIMSASCNAINNSINWTEDEMAFMDEHPVIRLGVDPKFVPFEFFDDDKEYKGIAADYLSLISEKTGLEFDIARDLTWPEAYELALQFHLVMIQLQMNEIAILV